MLVTEDDRFFELLKFVNTMWNEGLIDPEYSLNNTSMWEEKMTTEQGFVTYDYMVRCEGLTNPVKAANPDASFEMGAIALPDAGNGYKPGTWSNGTNAGNQVWLISADTEYPEACIKLLDCGYSDEMHLLRNYGIEGVHYEMVNGKPQFLDTVATALNNFQASGDAIDFNTVRANRGALGGLLTDTEAYGLSVRGQYSWPGSQLYIENDWLQEYIAPIPLAFYGAGEKDEATDHLTAVQEYFSLQMQDFIEGKRPLNADEYAKFQQEILDEGGAEWLDITNRAYAASQK